MYAKCGSMVDARKVFESIKHPNVVSWTALILGYAENGEGVTALELFERMKSKGCEPDSVAFVVTIKACTSLVKRCGAGKTECKEHGQRIHQEVGVHLTGYVRNTLIDMYSTCGSMPEARRVFDGMDKPDLVSWNALILGYAVNGDGATALDLFSRMKSRGYVPDCITFTAALKAISSLVEAQDEDGKALYLELGKRYHLEIGCHLNNYVRCSLVDMYGKCGSMADAREVFDSAKNPDVACWTALILGYAENGEGVNALDLFARMKARGFAPDSVTIVAALKACNALGDIESGCKIHAEINPDQLNVMVLTTLVDFYAKCGIMVKAQEVFDSNASTRNLKTWNSLLAGYSRLGDIKAAFHLWEGMLDADLQPDGVSFLSILTCCSHAGLVEKATECFGFMSKYGIIPDVEHHNCMADILGRSNKLDDAMTLLRSMPCRPNAVTWMTVLGSCHKWKHAGIGTLAFKSLLRFEYTNATAYVLMAQLYRSRGMWQEQEIVVGMKENNERLSVPREMFLEQ